MFGTAVGSGKQCVFATELDASDRSFDRVVVEFDSAVIDEARQALPARERVTDGVGELNLLADQSELGAQPRLEGISQRPASLLPHEAALLRTAAADFLLDRIECGNVPERLTRDRRGAGGREFVEVAPHVHPAECELDL